jgi:CDP-diacylglycerol--glycerol-3-phosphate 3-phosphatidyltransferase
MEEANNNFNDKPTITDKILGITFLKLFPKKVVPNHLTIFRFFTVPFVAVFLLMGQYTLAVILFIVSAFTDALDGAMARTRRQITHWGQTYDPLADKLLIGITAIIIIPMYLGVWLVFAIILADMFLIGTAYYFKNQGIKEIKANIWGKLKMFCQSVGLGSLLVFILGQAAVFLTIAAVSLYLAIFLALVSIVTYSL